jgi:hypothetical protein
VRLQQASWKAFAERKLRQLKRGLRVEIQAGRHSVFPVRGLAGSEVAATEILQQLADTNPNEQERPIIPEELENVDVSEVLDQEHRPNSDKNQRSG